MTKKQVLFFVGEDITAHLIVNRVMEDMVAKGDYEPVFYFAKNAPSKAAAAIPELREFAFFEKKLLNKTVYSFLADHPSLCQPNKTPDQISEQEGFHVEYVDNINDPEFVAKIAANENIACAISIRCTQIFKKDLVEAVKKTAPLLNVHSGLLPDYRGVMTTARRAFDIASGKSGDDKDYGCTIHKIDPFDPNAKDKGIDTGKILALPTIVLNPDHSIYQAHVGLVDIASHALISVLDEIRQQHTLRGYPQNNADSRYYTFPTAKEVADWKDAGIVLVRPQDAVNTLVNAFSKAGTSHGNKLQTVLRQAILEEYSQMCGCSVSGAAHLADGGCPNFAEYYTGSAANSSTSLVQFPDQRIVLPSLARA